MWVFHWGLVQEQSLPWRTWSAPVRSGCGGGTVVWIAGTLTVPGIQGSSQPRDAVWLRKRIENLPTSCTSFRLNPHNQVGKLCVYGIYKRTLRGPTKENTLALAAVDTGGKNKQE